MGDESAGRGEPHAQRGAIPGDAGESRARVVDGRVIDAVLREQSEAAANVLFVDRVDVVG